ncbi:MAG: hypothetical protein ACREP5_02400, partial [Candidatus Binatia bacterium]
FMIERDGTNAHEGALANLLQQLDTSLSALNIEYADKRKSGRLKAPILCIMKSGWFERKAGTALRAGARDVQFKAQLLSATPEESSEILFVVDSGDSTAEGSVRRDVDFPPR